MSPSEYFSEYAPIQTRQMQHNVIRWNEHLLRGVSAETACLEGFDSDGDRWFAVNSIGGATHRTELSAAERVIQIQLTSVDVKLDVPVFQISPHSDVNGFTVVILRAFF